MVRIHAFWPFAGSFFKLVWNFYANVDIFRFWPTRSPWENSEHLKYSNNSQLKTLRRPGFKGSSRNMVKIYDFLRLSYYEDVLPWIDWILFGWANSFEVDSGRSRVFRKLLTNQHNEIVEFSETLHGYSQTMFWIHGCGVFSAEFSLMFMHFLQGLQFVVSFWFRDCLSCLFHFSSTLLILFSVSCGAR